jgi:hypothetical protein
MIATKLEKVTHAYTSYLHLHPRKPEFLFALRPAAPTPFMAIYAKDCSVLHRPLLAC